MERCKSTVRVRGFARENRNNPTPAELKFKMWLDENNIRYKYQYPIGLKLKNGDVRCFILDFKSGRTVFEIDGGYHSTEEQKEKDYIRTKALESLGYIVVRIPNEFVLNNNLDILLPYFHKGKRKLSTTQKSWKYLIH